MPKVIKSAALQEEYSLLRLDLPSGSDLFTAEAKPKSEREFLQDIFAVKDADAAEKDDYMRYFNNIDAGGEKTDFDDIKKYYSDMKKYESYDDLSERKYFYFAPKEEKAAEETAEREDYDESPVNEEAAEEPAPAEEADDELAALETARLQAQKIIAEARLEAETIKMKLAAEISEAEVKKELTRSIAVSMEESARQKSEDILKNAEEQAVETLENAKKSGYAAGYEQGSGEGRRDGLAQGLEEGQKTGYAKGLEEGTSAGQKAGRTDGFAAARAEMTDELNFSSQRAKDILVKAEKDRDAIIASADDQIIKIVMAVVDKILNKEIEENPFMILPIVKEAANKVADQPRLFISVSPANYELVQMALGDIKKMLGGKQELTVVSDATLGPADTIIGTGGSGDVDARLATQLNEIRKTIEMVMRQ